VADAHKHVLVVDDEDDVREALRMVLEEAGYRVGEASDGAAALDYLRAHDGTRVVLLDLMMPTFSGEQFLAAKRREPALGDPAIVVVSASTRERLEQTVAEHGLAGFLRKPVQLEALLATVEQHCGGQRPE
jgi:two-component system chemotaxis response regulator CheY